MKKNESANRTQSQVDKFREAARDLETDESEDVFDRTLKEIAKSVRRDETDTSKKKPAR